MSNQHKALRLADELDAGQNFYAESSISFDFRLSNAASEAAAELRRLHELNSELLAAIKATMAFVPDSNCEIMHELHTRCRDAIAKTE